MRINLMPVGQAIVQETIRLEVNREYRFDPLTEDEYGYIFKEGVFRLDVEGFFNDRPLLVFCGKPIKYKGKVLAETDREVRHFTVDAKNISRISGDRLIHLEIETPSDAGIIQ